MCKHGLKQNTVGGKANVAGKVECMLQVANEVITQGWFTAGNTNFVDANGRVNEFSETLQFGRAAAMFGKARIFV